MDENHHWKLKMLDIESKEIEILRKTSGKLDDISPRIVCNNDMLVFISKNNKDSDCYVTMYDLRTFKFKDIVKLNYVINPYNVPCIMGNKIYFIDCDDKGWFVAEYDTTNQSITEYIADTHFLTNYISGFSVSNDKLVYSTNFGETYIVDLKSKSVEFLKDGVEFYKLLNNHLIYTFDGKACSYDFNTKKHCFLTTPNEKLSYNYFFNRDELSKPVLMCATDFSEMLSKEKYTSELLMVTEK